MRKKPKKKNTLLWLFEPLENDPRYFRRKFFHLDAAYLDGRLYLTLRDAKDEWSGMMVCTYREHHASLCSDFPQLKPHRVLGKWLHLSLRSPEFESVAQELVELTLKRDPRLGIDPK